MSLQIRIYDRTGQGLWRPEGGWIDLDADVPAWVKGAIRTELPYSTSNEHPRLDPEVLQNLHRSTEGALWSS